MIDSTIPCSECDGTGFVLNFEGDGDEPCDCCLGLGLVPKPESISVPVSVITLWQPWATWIAKRIKTHETRSWPTKYRGKILIHAAKRKINWNDVAKQDLETLKRHFPDIQEWEYPLGEIVAQGELIDCYPTWCHKADLIDECCGNWGDDRFAWLIQNVTELNIPKVAGMQGLWKFQIESNLLTPTINDHIPNWQSRSVTELVLLGGGNNAT